MSTSRVEVLGRCALIADLTRGDVEVAQPERDIGIDLIAYLHTGEAHYIAVPIQLKAATGQAFSIDRKYESIPTLLMAYVWNVDSADETEVYCLSYPESIEIADRLGYTSNKSWIEGNRYSISNKPSVALRQALGPHRMTPEMWGPRIRKAWQVTPVGLRPERTSPEWMDDAAESFQAEAEWQALPASARLGDEGDPVPVQQLHNAIGSDRTLVVRSHTEGLGPKSVFGRMVSLCDVMTRTHGRLRPFPAVHLDTGTRQVIIPVNLIEAFYSGDCRAELNLPDPYDFSGLTPSDEVSGDDYILGYPHN